MNLEKDQQRNGSTAFRSSRWFTVIQPVTAPDRHEVIKRAVAGCDGVLTVLVPWGVHQYSSGTAQAVLDHAPPGARLVFSCGWHITRDGQDVYSWKLKAIVKGAGRRALTRSRRGLRRPGGSVPEGVYQR
jgi:hypothetical protein